MLIGVPAERVVAEASFSGYARPVRALFAGDGVGLEALVIRTPHAALVVAGFCLRTIISCILLDASVAVAAELVAFVFVGLCVRGSDVDGADGGDGEEK